MGYSKIHGECEEISADLRVYVNETSPCEIWTVTLTNIGNENKEISLYSFADFQLDGYERYSDYNSYVHAEYKSDENLIICYNSAMERPHSWFNGFMASNREPTAFDTSKRAFIGTYDSEFMPLGIRNEQLSNSLAACEEMVGALQHDFVLSPGESVTTNILIGATDNEKTAVTAIKKLFDGTKIQEDFEYLISKKEDISKEIWISTPDEKINNFVNYWLKQQVQLCAEVGRDTGKGFRDQLQDAWAVASFNPKLAANKILETLTFMYSDGRCVRGWLPLDHHIYSDGPVWVAPTVNAYIKETGDREFLSRRVKYLDEGEDTVWEHILTAMRFASDDIGEHGLVHSRDGDWNDSLNMTGLKGKGESVWTSIALCYALKNTSEIAEKICNDIQIRDEMLRYRERLINAINKNAWDGNWYLAAINDYGEKVGSSEEEEGKIYLNSQTWAILADICDDDKKSQCMASVDKFLDSPYGPLTLYPTYTKFNDKIGRLTGFIPGIWENGTPYCHGGAFKVVADCICGRGDKAYKTIKRILPDSESNPSEHSGCEPYVVTNMYFGPDNPRSGETLFAWVTGTAGWMLRAVTQYMLGFTPEYNGFSIKPCLPNSWKEVEMERQFRGDKYIIKIKKSNLKQEKSTITVDGKPFTEMVIPLFGDGKTHEIVVSI